MRGKEKRMELDRTIREGDPFSGRGNERGGKKHEKRFPGKKEYAEKAVIIRFFPGHADPIRGDCDLADQPESGQQ